MSGAVRMPPPTVSGMKELVGGALHEVLKDTTLFRRGGDVVVDQFVGALLVVAQSQLDGVAGVLISRKLHAAHHAAAIHVETGDNASCKHSYQSDSLHEIGKNCVNLC